MLDRAMTDAHEASLLRDVITLGLWKHMGMASAVEYVQWRFDYSADEAQSKLRAALGEHGYEQAMLAKDAS